jgi:hypothetical protein
MYRANNFQFPAHLSSGPAVFWPHKRRAWPKNLRWPKYSSGIIPLKDGQNGPESYCNTYIDSCGICNRWKLVDFVVVRFHAKAILIDSTYRRSIWMYRMLNFH